MFGVANRRNNIALAGKLASNHLSQAIANTTKYSPNAGEIVMQGMEAKNYKEIAKIKNDAQRDYYAQTGQVKIDGFNDLNAATAKAEDQQRMAGMLAGLGAVSYGVGDYVWNKNNPPPAPVKRESADGSKFQTQLDDLQTGQKEWQTKIENLLANSGVQSWEDIRSGLDGKGSSSSTDSKPSTAKPLESTGASGTSVSTEFKPWSPLSSTIALAEGTLGQDGKISYGTFYGGGKFTNFDKHPDIVHHTQSGSSAAAGGYQFMPSTWKGVASELNLTDFSPVSQEAAARQLAKWRGVDPDAKITSVSQLRNTFNKLSGEWAGLPNLQGVSTYDGINGNKSMAFDRLRKHYEKVAGYTLTND